MPAVGAGAILDGTGRASLECGREEQPPDVTAGPKGRQEAVTIRVAEG